MPFYEESRESKQKLDNTKNDENAISKSCESAVNGTFYKN